MIRRSSRAGVRFGETRGRDERASIGWTSYSHTGVPVPVYAIGQDAQRFEGFYDNTDIAKQLARAMNIHEPLPVLRELPAVN